MQALELRRVRSGLENDGLLAQLRNIFTDDVAVFRDFKIALKD